MLQGNSDLKHNNLALSRDDDTENREFSNAKMDSAEAENTCALQEKKTAVLFGRSSLKYNST